MTNSLRIDDEDSVVIVEYIEKAFDVDFENWEAASILTVGQMHDLLGRKLPATSANRKCASAMAFYRLRRALLDLRREGKLPPSFDMSRLGTIQAKSFFKQLEVRAGLNMPEPAYSWLGKIGGYIALLWLPAMLALIPFALLRVGVPKLLSYFCWAALPTAYLLAYLDPRRLPKDCVTLGGLADKVARLSYGRLVELGADSSEKTIWQTLVELLADFSAVPSDQITRETVFLDSQLRMVA